MNQQAPWRDREVTSPSFIIGSVDVFAVNCEVRLGRYAHQQLRLDLRVETERDKRLSAFDADGVFEVTTSIKILLTKPPFSWVDTTCDDVTEVLEALIQAGLVSTDEPYRRLPPFGQLLQQIRCLHCPAGLLPARRHPPLRVLPMP